MTDHRRPDDSVLCMHCGGELLHDGLSFYHRSGNYCCADGKTAAEPGRPVPDSSGRGYYRDRITSPWNERDALSAKLRDSKIFARGLSGPA